MNEIIYAMRQAWRNPGVTAISALALGLGIGLVSTQFTLIDGILLRPLPFANADRIFHVGQPGEGGTSRPITSQDYVKIQAQQSAFEEIGAFQPGQFNLSRAGTAARSLQGNAVTASFFNILRERPALGRVFTQDEDQPGDSLLLVMGNGIWKEEFGSSPNVIGQSVKVNGEPATVIGVMPAGFAFPGREECWVNLRLARDLSKDRLETRLEGIGLLKPEKTPQEAEANLELIIRRSAESQAEASAPVKRVRVARFQTAHSGSGTTLLLTTMLAMTGLVLLLACGNVANLLFARTTGRLRDLAVRSAMGASRGRIFRQILLESTVLAALGAGLGILLSAWGAELLSREVIARVPVASWVRFDLNLRVLGFTLAVSVLAGLFAGLLPAWRASRLDPIESLKDEGRGATGLRLGRISRWLVTGQIAFASGLVASALILALSAMRSSRANLAYDPNSLLLGRIELMGEAYKDAEVRARFYNNLVDLVKATPGVAAAAVSSRDLVSQGVYSQFEIEGAAYPSEREKPGAWLEVVSRDYLSVVNRKELAGRFFGTADQRESEHTAVVNESFARKYWPGQDPIGKRIRRNEDGAQWARIIGIAPDLTMEGVAANDPPAGWYLLQDQQGWGWLDLLVRSKGDPAALIPALRKTVSQIDAEQPIQTITTLTERTARRVAGIEIVGKMAGIFAITALVLAGVGLFGVISFAVNRRAREFGIRAALGATGKSILGLLFRQNLGQLAAGIIVGLGLGFALMQPVSRFLPNVSVSDARIYGAVAFTMCAVAAAAIWGPARRASKADPVVALRAE